MTKKVILWLHKWLGIITGIVVFFVSITGAIYTFQDELKLLVYPDKYFVLHKATTAAKPLSELITIAQKQLPSGESVSRVDLYPDASRSWIFRASETNAKGFGHWNYFRYYKRVFVNPYTGKVVAVEDTKHEFFQLCLQLHMNLLLGKTYGHALVGYSTAVFVLLLLSGIVLWWPKKWRGKPLKRAVSLDWKAKWKRFNYDLHNVFGFYSFFIALIIATTGLVFAFPGFKKSYTDFFNHFSVSEAAPTPLGMKVNETDKPYSEPLDNALHYLLKKYPAADMMSIRLRAADSPLLDIQVRMEENRSGVFKWYYFKRDDLHIDQVKDSQELVAGDKLAALNFDLHTGSIGGLPTKLLLFVVSLFCASLPVTGYILWWQKGSKKKKKR
ncbi:PepSY-associated TM helix domain-containing protein [Sphingobacterium oryzagri]|uniref:PepSY-associated TM helix domain-containing protein n=1 Tax=Sphingobacterium oryzagri TaxID=3025669 RepID=A0ABY7WFT6_9SPHI|nr:PepSY-associated TM helix domain-containing protein [Sphingobacterium sp. KACC 22765]WDF67479.1 PepSY-associated TM helix domain-containing protein [Sphingobacterium sp. KACC 22765]